MKRFLIMATLIGAVSALPLIFTEEAGAARKANSSFLGLWGGIDTTDGSAQQILISRGENGDFSLAWYETFWTACSPGGRGVMEGSGQLAPTDKKVLVMDITISCFDPDDPDLISDTVTFVLADKDMLLATAGAGVFVDLPLFRLSQRLKGNRQGDDDD